MARILEARNEGDFRIALTGVILRTTAQGRDGLFMVIFLLSVIAIGVLLLSDAGRVFLGFCLVIAIVLFRLALAGVILVAVLFVIWFVVQTLRGA